MSTRIPLSRTGSDPAASDTARAEPKIVYPTFQSVAAEIGIVLAVMLGLAFAVTLVLKAYGLA